MHRQLNIHWQRPTTSKRERERERERAKRNNPCCSNEKLKQKHKKTKKKNLIKKTNN